MLSFGESFRSEDLEPLFVRILPFPLEPVEDIEDWDRSDLGLDMTAFDDSDMG